MDRFSGFVLSFVLLVGSLSAEENNQKQQRRTNIVVIFGDDIDQSNISWFTKGLLQKAQD